MFKQIEINDIHDVNKLNRAALDYGDDLTITTGSVIIDPRSLLALCALTGVGRVNVVAPDHANPQKFAEFLQKI